MDPDRIRIAVVYVDPDLKSRRRKWPTKKIFKFWRARYSPRKDRGELHIANIATLYQRGTPKSVFYLWSSKSCLTLDPGDVGTIRIWIRNAGYLINNMQTTKLSMNPNYDNCTNLMLFTQFWKSVSSYVVVHKAGSLPEPPTQTTGLPGRTLRQGETN